MGSRLEEIVPWGRSLDEYIHMFRQATKDIILAGVTENRDAYQWQMIHSPQHLCEVRLTTMDRLRVVRQ